KGTTAPTQGNCEATATTRSPFPGSNATIENVTGPSPPGSTPAGRPDELERRTVLLEMLQHVPRADRHGLERLLGDMHRDLALLREELIQTFQEAPAAREEHAGLEHVVRQLGGRVVERPSRAVDDPPDRIHHR